ncbi:hypothetical protein ACFUTX_09820 [Microbacterium sp. NPDC057407]|uniref:hypothetical protein n=1 Tax=Microbacterium sp. NPDC057407 TaxID=3346120 RepID=UPI00366E0B32
MPVFHELVIDGDAVPVPTAEVDAVRDSILELVRSGEPTFLTIRLGERRHVAFLITSSTSVRIETTTTPDDPVQALDNLEAEFEL